MTRRGQYIQKPRAKHLGAQAMHCGWSVCREEGELKFKVGGGRGYKVFLKILEFQLKNFGFS